MNERLHQFDVIATCTHAVMVGMAMQRLSDAPISRIVITDSIPDGERLLPIRDKITILSVAPLLAQAVHRIHHDMSISALFEEFSGSIR